VRKFLHNLISQLSNRRKKEIFIDRGFGEKEKEKSFNALCIHEVVERGFDIICFFTPGGIKSLIENFPKFKQNGTTLAAFGANTFKAAEEAGLVLDIKAPMPQSPSMVSALEVYLKSLPKK